jgi:hypothetical protein
MKQKFRRGVALFCIMAAVLVLTTPAAQAKNTVKLNKTKATLYVGDTVKLKLTGTGKRVTWSSSKKSVATVSSTGKVKAKKVGKVTITAKVSGKKYNCKVTVKETKNADKKIVITAGSKKFSLSLYDNEAAKKFATMLPLTVNMSELNGNEKYCYLSESLPTKSERPSGIQKGDLMLYGSDCLVLFYESFSTSYSYTALGKIDDPEGLEKALGSGAVRVTFESQQ